MSALAKIILAAAVGGVVVGGALGFASAPDGEGATLALDGVPVYVCPGETEIGTLHRGDRVFITGRSGEWLAIRNVRGSGERVFVNAASVVPDADLGGLPEVGCETIGAAEVLTTETTIVEDTTTTTAATDDTSTTTSSSTTTTSTSTTTTTTTLPAPSVGSVSRSPGSIWEQYAGDPPYSCNQPSVQTVVTASASAPAGLKSITVSWSSSATSGSKAMSGTGPFAATIGPIDALPDNGLGNGQSVTVNVTVTIVDVLDRQAAGQTSFTLNGCVFG